jgi:hypothetical protein
MISYRGLAAATIMFVAGFGGNAAALPDRTYDYVVENPNYGQIGTYRDTIEQDGTTRRIDSRLRVAVRVLGFVVHREDADCTEIWRGDRLVWFHGVTVTNGHAVEVKGEAKGGNFIVSSPAGTTTAPASVYPSTPWVPHLLGSRMLMSTKTGEVVPAQGTGGEPTFDRVEGVLVPVHHYVILSDKKQEIWRDGRNIPVHFRSVEESGPVDFRLTGESQGFSSGSIR